MRPAILTFVRYYQPGFKSGGPVRTIVNLVAQLHGDFDFRIVTSDRDVLDAEPYSGILAGEWNDVGPVKVLYVSPERQSLAHIKAILRETRYDVLYLNSFFDAGFALRPLWAQFTGCPYRRPTVLAPRGEFSEGALYLKRWKKKPYIWFARAAGLYRDIVWQASSEYELADIRRAMGPAAKRVIIAPNLPTASEVERTRHRDRGRGEKLKVLFLSRISRKKNLEFALRVLSRVRTDVDFSIYGTVEDDGYWQQCQSLIARLGGHVRVTVMGPANPSDVPAIMAEHDLFLLPTLGENYGHVIAEALSAGTPVLIANTTPWRDLDKAGVGWDLSLDSEEAFAVRIDHCAGVPDADYVRWRSVIQTYARGRLLNPSLVDANRNLFMSAIGSA
jgi:glycosyltransferase involved in cell wall biosynthesis